MERLLDHDFQVILDFLLEIYSPAALRKFPDRLIESLHKLIPSDLVTYDEMDPDRRTSTDRGSPADMMRPELRQESWPRVMQEHPPLMYFRRTGDPCACRISDFLSQQKFRCSALYQEFYRKMGIEDVLCKALGACGPIVIGCSFSRSRRSFSDRDCLVFDLIGPHLTQAWRNARAISGLRRKMQAADSALQAVDAGLVALSPGGRVRLMTPCAKRMLAEFFGGRFLSACHLPEEVTHWVRDQKKQFAPNRLPQPLRPLVVPREGAELVVRLLPDSSQDLLLIQVCGHAINLPRLKEKGLTKREIEVLACVTKGKTNEEVGQHLEIRPRTVQKHLEHIFVKLGVETRTAAAAFALG